MYITISDRRGPAVPPRQGRLQGRAAGAARVLPAARVGQDRRDLQPLEAVRRSAEADRLLQGPRLRLRQRHAARRRSTRRRGPSTSRSRSRRARWSLRAHQHPRQHQDARQGDPPRDAHLRGRAVQPDAARLSPSGGSRRSASSRRSTCRPSAGQRRQDGRQRRGRGAADRHVPDRRRLLVGRELHRPGADLAEQPVRPRPAADAAGAAVQPAPAVPAAVPRPLLPRHQVDVRLQPVQAGPVPVLVRALARRAGR